MKFTHNTHFMCGVLLIMSSFMHYLYNLSAVQVNYKKAAGYNQNTHLIELD